MDDPNPWELPLLCPTNGQLDQLLHLSLTLEAQYLPKLHRKAVTEHRAAFHAATTAMSKPAYCWIDTDVVLRDNAREAVAAQNSLWRDYIVDTFSRPAKRSP